MRSWGLAIAIGLSASACADEPGIHLEVHVPPGVDDVEVFLGIAECEPPFGDTCRIVPRNHRGPHPLSEDKVWLRDADQILISETHGRSIVRFRLVATAPDQVVQLITVGKTDRVATALSVIPDLQVPEHEGVIVRTTLVPTPPVVPDVALQPGGEYVQVWEPSPCDSQLNHCAPPSSCVLVERRTADGGVTRLFVVPEGDPDCDGYPTHVPGEPGQLNPEECLPYHFEFAGRRAPTSLANCAVFDSNDHGICRVGGPTCSDGEGVTSDSCVPITETWCLPTAACTPGCNVAELAYCTNSAPSIYCTIATQLDGTPCSLGGARLTRGTLDLAPLFAASNRSCDSIKVSAGPSLFMPGFATTFQLTVPATTPPTEPAELALDDLMTRCSTTLVWKGEDQDAAWTGGVVGTVPTHRIAEIVVSGTDTRIHLPIKFERGDLAGSEPCANVAQGIVCEVTSISAQDSLALCAQ
jgi:hypothetical protein